MHEFGLAESIIAAVDRRAAGRRVTEVTVRIGALHRAEEPALGQAFEMIRAGTVAENAELKLVVVPVTVSCRACGHHGGSQDAWSLCERCGSEDVEVSGGQELLLESIRVDDDVPSQRGA